MFSHRNSPQGAESVEKKSKALASAAGVFGVISTRRGGDASNSELLLIIVKWSERAGAKC